MPLTTDNIAESLGVLPGDLEICEWCETPATPFHADCAQYPDVMGPGRHVHRCPECCDTPTCEFECFVEVDLRLWDDTPCGAYVVCDDCACMCGHGPLDHKDGQGCELCPCENFDKLKS